MTFARRFKLLNLAIMAVVYPYMEVLLRAFTGSLVHWNGVKYLSLIGWTSLWMSVVGGGSGWLIGQLNDRWKMPVIVQSFLGTVIILSFEFTSGVLFNIILDLHLWDYSDLPFNVMGQICLPFGLIWICLITPLAIWIDDRCTYYIYREGELYNFFELYHDMYLEIKQFITRKT